MRVRYNLSDKTSKLLRSSIDDGDLEMVIACVKDAYTELAQNNVIDDEDANDYIAEIDDIDLTVEDVDYILQQFYDLCDNIGVWIPTTFEDEEEVEECIHDIDDTKEKEKEPIVEEKKDIHEIKDEDVQQALKDAEKEADEILGNVKLEEGVSDDFEDIVDDEVDDDTTLFEHDIELDDFYDYDTDDSFGREECDCKAMNSMLPPELRVSEIKFTPVDVVDEKPKCLDNHTPCAVTPDGGNAIMPNNVPMTNVNVIDDTSDFDFVPDDVDDIDIIV